MAKHFTMLYLRKTFTDMLTNPEEGKDKNTIVNQREMELPPKPSQPFLQQEGLLAGVNMLFSQGCMLRHPN